MIGKSFFLLTQAYSLPLNEQDDEMCVKVDSKVIPMSEKRAAEQLREAISFKSKGIDGDYTGSA